MNDTCSRVQDKTIIHTNLSFFFSEFWNLVLYIERRGPPLALKDAGHYFGSTKSIFPEKDEEEEATAQLSVALILDQLLC